MRILTPGDPKKNKPDVRFICKNCGCIFVAEYGEYTKHCSQIEGTSYSAQCPDCKEKVWQDG